ncbi:unnamed protein product [Effrenium voratum]|uniref:Uncharacterized protein n=1 Tax=Effrenium voratum TaxID=2562239 RepID=A0AA36JRB1_9DINO|nr:unnamed protein product [Effrenium voratum]
MADHGADKAELLSRFLAKLLRLPDTARKHRVQRDREGWAKCSEVEAAALRARNADAALLRRVLQESRYDNGEPRFEERTDKTGKWVRSTRKRHDDVDRPEVPPSVEPAPARDPNPDTSEGSSPEPVAEKPSSMGMRSMHSTCMTRTMEFLQEFRELLSLMWVNKAWQETVWPRVRCAGWRHHPNPGLKSKKLPCGHRVCARCQNEMCKCPKCGRLRKSRDDASSLKSLDDPRTCSSSMVSSIASSVASEICQLRWVCRPLHDGEPFDEELKREEVKVVNYLKNTPGMPEEVTRYWSFTTGTQAKAKLFCLQGIVEIRGPSTADVRAHCFFESEECTGSSEKEAVRNLMRQLKPSNRWNKERISR